jgi:hypothetical protein
MAPVANAVGGFLIYRLLSVRMKAVPPGAEVDIRFFTVIELVSDALEHWEDYDIVAPDMVPSTVQVLEVTVKLAVGSVITREVCESTALDVTNDTV